MAVLSLTAHFSVCSHRGFMKSRTNGHNKLQQWKYSAKLSPAQPGSAHYCRRGANGTADADVSGGEERRYVSLP